MIHQTYKNKGIIWQSRTSQILLVIGCLIFVVAAICIRQEISTLALWINLILFGGGGLITLRQLLDPNNLFVKPNAAFAREMEAEFIRNKQEDAGAFAYDRNGFTYKQLSGATYFQWKDIASLFGYDVLFHDDRSIAQETNLDIFTNKYPPITIMESTPGFHQFLNKLSENIPTIPRNWVEEARKSSSVTHPILLFDQQGRAKELVQKECYQDKYDRLPGY